MLSTADARTHDFARPYLEKAGRIVVIAEHWKIGREDGDTMELPGLGSRNHSARHTHRSRRRGALSRLRRVRLDHRPDPRSRWGALSNRYRSVAQV